MFATLLRPRLELFGRYRLEVGEVEAQAVGADVAARLLHVVAQTRWRSAACRIWVAGVVAGDASAAHAVYHAADTVIAHGDGAFVNLRHCGTPSPFREPWCRVTSKLRASCCDGAGIANFAAHLRVERGRRRAQLRPLRLHAKRIDALAVAYHERQTFASAEQWIHSLRTSKRPAPSAGRRGCRRRCSMQPRHPSTFAARARLRCSSMQRANSSIVDGKAALFADFLGYLYREAVGVMQNERGARRRAPSPSILERASSKYAWP